MTCGNGHDTLFLARLCKKVVAVDIQEAAIQSTQERCKDFNTIEYLHRSHDSLVFESDFDGAIYNLGYLPGGDKSLTTQSHSTLGSIRKVLDKAQRFIVISCYRKHPGGNKEYHDVKSLLDDQKLNYEIFSYDTELSPVTFLIKL